MSIAIHIVNTPKTDTRQAYDAAWEHIHAQGVDHPEGRESHTAWLVGDVLHVLDIWDSQEHLNAWRPIIGAILQEVGMEIDGQPSVGEVLQVVRPMAAVR